MVRKFQETLLGHYVKGGKIHSFIYYYIYYIGHLYHPFFASKAQGNVQPLKIKTPIVQTVKSINTQENYTDGRQILMIFVFPPCSSGELGSASQMVTVAALYQVPGRTSLSCKPCRTSTCPAGHGYNLTGWSKSTKKNNPS